MATVKEQVLIEKLKEIELNIDFDNYMVEDEDGFTDKEWQGTEVLSCKVSWIVDKLEAENKETECEDTIGDNEEMLACLSLVHELIDCLSELNFLEK